MFVLLMGNPIDDKIKIETNNNYRTEFARKKSKTNWIN